MIGFQEKLISAIPASTPMEKSAKHITCGFLRFVPIQTAGFKRLAVMTDNSFRV